MKILITGGNGFIGRHCAAALACAGHDIVCGVRHSGAAATPACTNHVAVDFSRDFEPEVWRPRLAGIDVVINTVGVFSERAGQSFEAIHAKTPRALFTACAALDVPVINISALGADENARSRFHVTKKDADDCLLSVHPRAVVLQPSLVFGTDGESTRLFLMLASLPVIPLIGSGSQLIQPVHVDDVAAAVTVIVNTNSCYARKISIVGPVQLPMRGYLQALRRGMGLKPAPVMRIPAALIAAVMRSGLFARWISSEALQMLERGNTADAAGITQVLGRAPRSVDTFIPPGAAQSLMTTAKVGWLAPILRCAVAIVWFAAAITSFALYPVDESAALVEAIGVSADLAPAFVYLGATLDLVLGLGIFFLRRRAWLWRAQIAVIVIYTAIISIWLPEFWLHPFGPVVKNVPLVAAIYLLYELERR